MADDGFGSEMKASVFPFLSVLICMMGVMVLILVGGSLKATVGGEAAVESVGARHKKTVAMRDSRKRRLDELKEEIGIVRNAPAVVQQLSDETSGMKTRIGGVAARNVRVRRSKRQESARATALRKRDVAARKKSGKIAVFRRRRSTVRSRDEARGLRQVSAQELTRRQEAVKGLKTRIGSLESDREKYAQEAQSPQAVYTVAGGGADERRVVLDLHRDFVEVKYSDVASVKVGDKVERAKAVGRDGFLEKVAQELAAPGSPGYALLLVRPGATGLYSEAKRAFVDRRARFRHAPIESNWRPTFVFPEGGP